MIIADRKPLAEIQEMIADCRKVLLVGCKGCVTVCNVGGLKEVEILASSLRIGRNRDGKPIEVDETVLVVSATSSTRTLNDVADKFKNTKYSSVIFSKVDEAVSYGNIMNLAVTHNVPVMFLTNGQVIPDDIVSVNPAFLANLVFTGKLYK